MKHPVLVVLDGARRDGERLGDLLGRAALGEQLKYFPLPRRQGLRRGGVLACQQLARQRRRDEGAPAQRRVDSHHELHRGGVLDDVAHSPGLEGASRIGGVLVHRQHHDRDLRIVGLQPADRLDPVQVRHRDVGDNDVRLQPSRGRDQCPAVLDDPDQVEVVREDALQPLGQHDVVVSQQYARAAHRGPPQSAP